MRNTVSCSPSGIIIITAHQIEIERERRKDLNLLPTRGQHSLTAGYILSDWIVFIAGPQWMFCNTSDRSTSKRFHGADESVWNIVDLDVGQIRWPPLMDVSDRYWLPLENTLRDLRLLAADSPTDITAGDFRFCTSISLGAVHKTKSQLFCVDVMNYVFRGSWASSIKKGAGS